MNEEEKTFLEKNKKDIKKIGIASIILLFLAPIISIGIIFLVIKLGGF